MFLVNRYKKFKANNRTYEYNNFVVLASYKIKGVYKIKQLCFIGPEFPSVKVLQRKLDDRGIKESAQTLIDKYTNSTRNFR